MSEVSSEAPSSDDITAHSPIRTLALLLHPSTVFKKISLTEDVWLGLT